MQVLHEDDFSQTVIDDGGRVLVVPRGMLNTPAPLGIGAGGAPGGALPVPAPAAVSPPVPEVTHELPTAPPAPEPAPIQPPPPASRPQAPAAAPTPQLETKADVQAVKEGATNEALQANAIATDAAVQQAEVEAGVREQGEREQRELEVDRENAEFVAGKKREAKALAMDQAEKEFQSTKIDEGRLWSDSSTAKKVGWGIAMALSGIGNTLMGKGDAVNPVVQMLTQAIDRDVQLQMDQRKHLGDVAARRAAELDKFDSLIESQQARFATRTAALKERVADRIITEASKFGGTQRAAAGLAAAAELKQAAAADRQKALDTETQVDLEKARLQQSEAASRRSAYVQMRGQDMSQQQWAGDFVLRSQDMMMRRQSEAVQLAAAGNKAAAEQVQKFGVADLKTAGGQMYTARSEKSAEEVMNRKAAVDSVVGLLDKLTTLKGKYGTETALLASPEYQQMKSLEGQIMNNLRVANQMGTLDKGSQDAIRTMMGLPEGTDITEGSVDALFKSVFRGDMTKGLETVRSSTIRNFNDYAKAARSPVGGDFIPYEPPDLREATHREAKTPIEQLVRDVQTRLDPNAQRYHAAAAADPNVGKAARMIGFEPGALPEAQRSAVEGLAVAASTGHADAVAGLRGLAQGQNAPLADYARRVADRYGIPLK